MKWQVEETLGEFGRHIGIDQLELSERNSLTLQIEQIGILNVEMVGDREERVAVSLARSYEEPLSEQALRFALEGCHYRAGRPFAVHAVLTGPGKLAFAVCLDVRDFSIQSMHASIDELDHVHESMKSVATLGS